MKLRPRQSLEGMSVQAAAEVTRKRLVLADVSNTRRIATEGGIMPAEKAKVTEQRYSAATKENAEVNESSTKRRQSVRQKATPKQNAEVNESSTKRRRSARLKATTKQNAEVNESSTKRRQPARLKATTKQIAEVNESSTKRRQPAIDAILPLSQFRLGRTDFDPSVHTDGLAPFDVKDKDDELKVSHYITDMCQHWFYKESEIHPGLYLGGQTDINSRNRATTINWLVEVHMKYRLVKETLYLSVNILDRYCAVTPVTRDHIQLVGVTALLIACKYEEIYPPIVSECVSMAGGTYTLGQFIDMEQEIIKTLEWKISLPTAFSFLSRFISIVNATALQAHAANYYMERTLQELYFLMYKPSLVCAAAVVLSLNNSDIYRAEKIKNPVLPGIPSILIEYTNFDLAKLLKCARELAKHVAEEPNPESRNPLIAVKNKFGDKVFGEISMKIKNPVFLDLWNAVPRKDRPWVFPLIR